MRHSLIAFLFTSFLFSPFAWILGDGLGPGAVDSTDVPALWKAFMTFYWGPITLTLIVLAVIAHYRRPDAG